MKCGTLRGDYEVATLLVQNKPPGGLDRHWIPAIWPVPPSHGWVTRTFEAGTNCVNGFITHGCIQKNAIRGLISPPVQGTPVQATADGQVTFADFDPELGASGDS